MFVRVLGPVEVDGCGCDQRVTVEGPVTGQWTRGQVLELVQPDDSPAPVDARRRAVLTRREREVLTSVARGYDNREIADELGISVRTVSRHLENIRGKLGSRRRSELVRMARVINPEWAHRPELAVSDNASGPTWNIAEPSRPVRHGG